MRSVSPIPGNPWPRDMTITVDDRPHVLLELLWVREAYGLEPTGEGLPPLLTDAPETARAIDLATAERTAWEEAWPRVWHAAVRHAGRDDDPVALERLQSTPPGSRERAELFQQLIGVTWRDEFGDAAFDDPSYAAWSERGWERHRAAIPLALGEAPERRDLGALIPAWQAGLTKIVTVPCRGEFVRRISDHALLMTESVRAESTAYRRALSSFA